MTWPNAASWIWYCTLASSILTFMAARTGKVFPADWKDTLEFAAGVVAIISAWLLKSPAKEPPREVWTPEQRAAANGGGE